jgi:hypothetical protein
MTLRDPFTAFVLGIAFFILIAASGREPDHESWWRFTGDLGVSGGGFDERLYLLQRAEWACAAKSSYAGGTLLGHTLYVGRFSGERGVLEWIRDIDSIGERVGHYTLTLTLARNTLRSHALSVYSEGGSGNVIDVTYTRLDSAMEPTLISPPVAGQFVPSKAPTKGVGPAGLRRECDKDIENTKTLGAHALQRQYNPEYFSRMRTW